MKSVSIKAPAKLNLYLHILGKRTDGFHNLESLAVFTEFGDTLEITPSDILTLNVTGPFSESLTISHDRNLVMQAASMLRLRSGCNQGAQLMLHKQLPVGAGLGGGSSDAAAALLGLYRFWQLGYDSDETEMLLPLAKKLGSDVAVCLVRQAAMMRGTGDQVTPVKEFPEMAVVLVNPRQELLTADVYKNFSGTFSAVDNAANQTKTLQELIKSLQSKRNDLQLTAIKLMPEINNVLAAIQATSGCLLARMSGSGPTCFGLYATAREAEEAARRLQETYTTWWIVATRFFDWHKVHDETQ